MARYIEERSPSGEVMARGVTWLEPDIGAVRRLVVVGGLLMFGYGRFWIYDVVEFVVDQPYRWDETIAIVISWSVYGLVALTGWRWLRGGIRRAVVFHRGGATSTPYRLWAYSIVWPWRWYRIHDNHDAIRTVRIRPSMTLTWSGEQTDQYDVIVDHADGTALDLSVYLPKAEAREVADLVRRTLSDIRALGAVDVKPVPEAGNADGAILDFLLGPACRSYVRVDRMGVTRYGVLWWEGRVVTGLVMMGVKAAAAVIASAFLVAAYSDYMSGLGMLWVVEGIVFSVSGYLYLSIPQYGRRGLRRELAFGGDGGMATPNGLAMYRESRTISGDHEAVLRIVAQPAARRWGVQLHKRDGKAVFVAVDVSQRLALELAEALRLALGGIREEKMAGDSRTRTNRTHPRYRRRRMLYAQELK